MTVNEVVALAAVVLSVGTNVALYIHLSSRIETRLESVDRRLELIIGAVHEVDTRLTKLEPR